MIPTFQEALSDYHNYLHEQGYSAEPIWVFREDVIRIRRRVWIRWPLPAENIDHVERLYEYGRQQGFGLALVMLCHIHGRPCCYINVPCDVEEASHCMISGLKLSVITNPPQSAFIRQAWQWWLLLYFTRNHRDFDVPSRGELPKS